MTAPIVTPETTLRELGEILHARRAYVAMVESLSANTWRLVLAQEEFRAEAWGDSLAGAIAEALLLVDRGVAKAKAGAR